MSLESQKALLRARGGNVAGNIERNSRLLIEQEFRNFPNHKIANLNNEEIEVRVVHKRTSNRYTTSQSDQRTILTLPDADVSIGDIFNVDDEKFIVYDGNEMDIFPTHHALKLNNNLKIKTGEEKEVTGWTSIGQPIHGEITPVYFETPCYVTSTVVQTEFDSPINLPKGRLRIVASYSTEAVLQDGIEFEMYGDRYRIGDIDFTSVRNDKGIVSIVAEKIQYENN